MVEEKRIATFEVNGETYELAYEFNALVDAEDVTGCNLLAAIEGLSGGGVTAKQLRGLLYAMICPYRGFPKEPSDQVKAMGLLIRIDTLGDIIAAIGEACALAVSREFAEKYRASIMASPAPETEETEATEAIPQ
jgi:hypothetical protein